MKGFHQLTRPGRPLLRLRSQTVPVEDYNRQGILEVIKDPSRYNIHPVLTSDPEILEGDFITGDVPLLFSDFGLGEGVLSVVVPVSSQYALFYSSVNCEFCMSSEDVCKEINSQIFDSSEIVVGSSKELLEDLIEYRNTGC